MKLKTLLLAFILLPLISCANNKTHHKVMTTLHVKQINKLLFIENDGPNQAQILSVKQCSKNRKCIISNHRALTIQIKTGLVFPLAQLRPATITVKVKGVTRHITTHPHFSQKNKAMKLPKPHKVLIIKQKNSHHKGKHK